ncbi:MAG: lactate dehydrogenase [Candidatus Atribacteria bacterium]|nr:lactate dehydrogenase [Candidatus Atribacteria bacterium]
MMIYYNQFQRKLFFSDLKINDLPCIDPRKIPFDEIESFFYLFRGNWLEKNSLATLIHPDQISGKREQLNILQKIESTSDVFATFPEWIKEKIRNRQVGICNCDCPHWKERLEWTVPEQWTINIVGLGNVGGTLLTGLRLLGDEKINMIGIFDTNENLVSRWEQEINQVIDCSYQRKLPRVKILQSDMIFQADIVVFCVSVGVPPLGSEVQDVRMYQLKANSKLINYYAQVARKVNYQGMFAIVSDPVDLLCQSAFLSSNRNENGELDGKGLAADQIRGFGLGVMHGRVAYYAEQDDKTRHYLKKGRVFGPHGDGLQVTDDIDSYHPELSSLLAKKALNANMELRKIGYKPYVAPALSSGVFSLLALMNGQFHYSAGFLGGIFWGSKNRQTPVGIEWEQLNFSQDLAIKLYESYENLKKQAKNLEI